MTWAPEEWDRFCALLKASWAGEFGTADRKAWRILLDDVKPESAIVALKRLLYSGRKFYPRPAVADLLAELRVDPLTPTFDEAYPVIYRAAATGELPASHPLIAGFIELQTVKRLGQLPLDDPDWGEKTRRDLEAAWDRHCESWDGRQVAVLASGGSGMRQLDPLASLRLDQGEAA